MNPSCVERTNTDTVVKFFDTSQLVKVCWKKSFLTKSFFEFSAVGNQKRNWQTNQTKEKKRFFDFFPHPEGESNKTSYFWNENLILSQMRNLEHRKGFLRTLTLLSPLMPKNFFLNISRKQIYRFHFFPEPIAFTLEAEKPKKIYFWERDN